MSAPHPFAVWDKCYRDGSFRRRWEYREPGPELVALVAGGALRAGPSLDLGCGAGREAIWLAKHGFSAHGVDGSRQALAIARRRARQAGVPVDFRLANVLELPFPARSFTLATDRSCLHTIYRWDWPAYAREVARVMRPGGHVVIRAARTTAGGGFTHLRPKDLKTYFGRAFRTVGFEKIAMVSDSGDLPAHLAVLKRK